MTSTEETGIDLPDTAVGHRVRWVLDTLRGDDEVGVDVIKGAFSESFLAMGSAESIAAMFNNSSGATASATPVSIDAPTDYHAIVETIDEAGSGRYRLRVIVEQDEPHRISSLAVEPVYPAAAGAVKRAWEEVANAEPVRDQRPGAGAVDPALSDELERMVAEVRETHHFVGLAVSVAGPDGMVWFRGFGAARSSGGEVKPDTVFRIGSVSKTITGVGVMQLVESGKVGLDDPVNDHLKSYKVEAADGSEPITIRHLLSHTSGLGVRGGIDTGVPYGEAVPPLGEFYAAGLKAKKTAGEGWAYSNDAFTTLGHLIEEVNDKPFYESMEGTFFSPLGMTSSSYVRGAVQAERLVSGFSPDDEGFIECSDLDLIIRGAGSVYSTAEDMGRYAACLMNGGAPVLKRESLEEMWSKQHDLSSEGIEAHMGLAFIVHDVEGQQVPWHNGGWPGASTSMYVAPEAGRSVVLTANTFGTSSTPALDKLGMALLRRLLGLKAK